VAEAKVRKFFVYERGRRAAAIIDFPRSDRPAAQRGGPITADFNGHREKLEQARTKKATTASTVSHTPDFAHRPLPRSGVCRAQFVNKC
jgi:hypothetical protein